MKHADILREALALLDNGERWCKGHFKETRLIMQPEVLTVKEMTEESALPTFVFRHVDSYCSLGALREALTNSGPTSMYLRIVKALASFVDERHKSQAGFIGLARDERSIAALNDSRDTTYEDVALMFKQAIHALEELDECQATQS